MLFAVFCALCLVGIGIKLALDYRKRPALVARPVSRIGPIVLPADRYYHPGHTWAKPVGAGEVLVGLDAFARRIVGDVRALDLPSPGERVEQGRRLWTLRFDGRALDQPAPLDGEVIEVNEEILRHPERLREDPYERGWILKVRPRDEQCCVANLFASDLAKKWVELAIQDLQRSHSPFAGAVLQDGGELMEGIAKYLSEAQWEQFRKRYFPVA
jgi:glycine cleavage system H lipoate-binding protein